MIDSLRSLKGLIKQKTYHIDHALFRLHYHATVCLLLAFCLILSAKVLFGDVIDCQSRTLKRDSFYDNWCYSRGTFTEYIIDHEAYTRAVLKYNQSGSNDGNTTSPDPRFIVTTTEEPNLFTRAANVLVKLIEDDEPTTARPNASALKAMEQEIATEIEDEIDQLEDTSGKPFPIGLLKGTHIGDVIKNQFKRIHKFVKNSKVKVSPDLVYILPGVVVPRGITEEHTLVFSHFYYQYMPVILFLQAVFFYFPHFLWKCWEGGLISSICKPLYDNRFMPSEFLDSNHHLVEYLQRSFQLKTSLVYKYYFCHLLLLANLITQIIVLNVMFNNQFVTYGLDVIQYYFIDEDVYGMRDYFTQQAGDLNNPLDFLFPKVTSCRYVILSAAGVKPDEYSFSCVLPLNIFHDKFFLILWFWFLILSILTILQIVFDIMYATLPALRRQLFIRRFGAYLRDYSRHPTSLPELFLLDLIGTNSDPFAFSTLLRKLSKEE